MSKRCSSCQFFDAPLKECTARGCFPGSGNNKPGWEPKRDPFSGGPNYYGIPDEPQPVPTPSPEPTRGLRYNKGKRRFDLLPPDALALLADLLTKGSEKYAERNWELGMPYSDALGSLERHLMAWKAGVDNDDESTMNHMVHVMCNAMFLLTWQQRGLGTDDRQKVTMPEPYASSPNTRAS